MIDWAAFYAVAVATVMSALAVVTLVSASVRVHASRTESTGSTRRWLHIAEWGLYVVCGAAVLFGIYLVVPALHSW